MKKLQYTMYEKHMKECLAGVHCEVVNFDDTVDQSWNLSEQDHQIQFL